jgi:hypothetical protein
LVISDEINQVAVEMEKNTQELYSTVERYHV